MQFLKNLKRHSWRWPLVIRRVQGHSMVPVLPPGTLVFGIRSNQYLKAGDVIIFEREDREMIKRIERLNGNELFVLGDHPETSTDSRQFGAIDRSSVLARVIWPNTTKK